MPPLPGGAQAAGETLAGRVACPREGIHHLVMRHRDLADDVGCGAETVQAQPTRLGLCSEMPGAKVDEASAQQRCCVAVVIAGGQGEAEAFIGGGVLGKSAVAVIAREHRKIAEVFPLHGAERTTTAGSAKPWNAYALAYGEACCLRTMSNHLSHDLMPRHQVGPTQRQVAVDDVQIGAAYATGEHTNHHAVPCGLRNRFGRA